MPFTTEKDGEQITVYTQAEVDSEVAGLKVTLGQLKDEKAELKTKLGESETAKLNAEEAAAKATGDTETAKRISAEKDSLVQTELDTLKNSIRDEKSVNMLSSVVTEVGAGGVANEDLLDLIGKRFPVGYDMDKHEHTFSGDNVTTRAELVKAITESGRYDSYLAGTGSTGGDSLGNKGAGATTKKFNEHTGAELKSIKDNNPAEYERLRATRDSI